MKFTKTLIAVAIAGIAAVPMMASATTTLSGIVELKIDGDDSDAPGERPRTKVGDAGFDVGDVLFGISSEQAMNSGLTGYGSLRLDMDSFSNGPDQSADSVYVGVKGGFGDIRIGETGNPGEYGQVNDILTDMGEDIDQGIGYTGSFGGATLGIAYSPESNQNILGVGAKFAWNGLSIGVGMQNETKFEAEVADSVGINDAGVIAIIPGTPEVDSDETTNISASVGFAFAGASIAVGYAVLGDAVTTATGTDDETAIIVNVGYSIAGVSLGLTYDAQTESEDNKLRLDANYDLGGGMNIGSRIDVGSDGAPGGPEDLTEWRIVLGKSF